MWSDNHHIKVKYKTPCCSANDVTWLHCVWLNKQTAPENTRKYEELTANTGHVDCGQS